MLALHRRADGPNEGPVLRAAKVPPYGRHGRRAVIYYLLSHGQIRVKGGNQALSTPVVKWLAIPFMCRSPRIVRELTARADAGAATASATCGNASSRISIAGVIRRGSSRTYAMDAFQTQI